MNLPRSLAQLCVGFICSVFALRSNLGFGSASQWHHSVFTLAMQVSLRLRSGIAVASQFLHAGNVSLRLRSGIAVASQCLHANNAGLARLRSGIAASSRWQCKPRYGFAVASQWLRSVFTRAMQASLRLRSGIAASSRWQFRLRFDFAVV